MMILHMAQAELPECRKDDKNAELILFEDDSLVEINRQVCRCFHKNPLHLPFLPMSMLQSEHGRQSSLLLQPHKMLVQVGCRYFPGLQVLHPA